MDEFRRRLVRVAAAMNKRARRHHAMGLLRWEDLAALPAWCRYCGIGLEPLHGTFDHVVALERGGPNLPANLVRCCTKCQRSKFTKTAAEFAEANALVVTCALPGCGKTWKPRYAEYKRGAARFCSLSHAAKSRWVSA